jgi:hypothetical protein
MYDANAAASLVLAQMLTEKGWRLYGCQPGQPRFSGVAMHVAQPNAVLVIWVRSKTFTTYEPPPHSVNPPGCLWHLERNVKIVATGKRLDYAEIEPALRPPPPGAATVEGRWIWIKFSTEPPIEMVQQLALLGAAWSNKRRAYFIKDKTILPFVKEILCPTAIEATRPGAPTSKTTRTHGTNSASSWTTSTRIF